MLRQKMLRDMKQNKWQFISVMIMAFLGVYIFAGIGGEWAGVENYRKSYYRETNLADGWIWGEGFSDDDLNKVKNIEGVTAAEKRCYLEVKGEDEYMPTVYLYGLNENSISMPYIANGEKFDENAVGKVWLDKRFADVKGLKIGDSYAFSLDGTSFSLKIAGLVYSSEYQYYAEKDAIFPDFSKVGFAFCSYKSLPMKDYLINYINREDVTVEELVEEFAQEIEEIRENAEYLKKLSKKTIVWMLERADDAEFEQLAPFTQIIFTSSVNASELSDRIDEALKDHYAVFTTRAENEGIAMLDSEMEQHKMVSSVFPIAFLLIALLAIVTSMNRLVNAQRTQIGTLKALGFGKARITLHYVKYGFWLSFIGAVLGCAIGPFTLPFLFYDSMKSAFTLPEWRQGFDISFIYVAAGTVLACTLTTYLTVVRLLKDSPAESLRPKAPKNFRLSKIEGTDAWRKLNFNFRWSWRSIMRGKMRAVMGIVGTVSCMALLICAFSMVDCMEDLESWMYNEISVQQTRMVLDSETSVEDAQQIALDIDGEIIMSGAIEIKANGIKKTQTITVVDGSGCFYLTDSDRTQITPDDDTIAISKKTADLMGLKAGDEIEWHIYTSDKWVKTKISIVTRTPISQGLVITRNTLEELGYAFVPTYVDTLREIKEYKNESVSALMTAEDMHTFWGNYMESMDLMVSVIVFFALVLAVVVLSNLGQLSFTENERTNATLKVIGFSTGKILNLQLIQNFIYSVIGVILGVPCGLGLTYVMISSAGDEFDMMIKMSAESFLISAAITVGVSLFVSLLLRKRIKRLEMVASLKGVE